MARASLTLKSQASTQAATASLPPGTAAAPGAAPPAAGRRGTGCRGGLYGGRRVPLWAPGAAAVTTVTINTRRRGGRSAAATTGHGSGEQRCSVVAEAYYLGLAHNL